MVWIEITKSLAGLLGEEGWCVLGKTATVETLRAPLLLAVSQTDPLETGVKGLRVFVCLFIYFFSGFWLL